MESSLYASGLHYYFQSSGKRNISLDVDLCIYGANSGGIIAAIAARKQGLSVVLLEPSRYLGGLTAGGLSLTDIGNKQAIGGLAREFYRRVGRHYQVAEHWRFEPHVAEQVFKDWLEEEKIPCHFMSFLDAVDVSEGRIRRITTENGISVGARMFIDATYEGDLMAKSGVRYTVGRESNAQYGETYNGAQVRSTHQFNFQVSPYREEGKPSSGLLPGIDPDPYVQGGGDYRVQAYNFRLCLTNRAANRIPFTRPDGYERSDYELLARYCRGGYVPEFEKFDGLVNDKVDMNNHGAVSSDYIGGNHRFPEASYREREEIFQRHVKWVKGLLWFWSQDQDVSSDFRSKIAEWGWCADEFCGTGGFSHALYVREARRLVGDVVMTQSHCVGESMVDDSIALAAYTMDSHHCRRLVIDGCIRNEGDVQTPAGAPYPISYRALVPARGQCRNLLIPFCLSASHIAFGSIRMEPVYMILGESCATAAALAIGEKCAVQDVPYGKLRENLVAQKQVLDPVERFRVDPQTGE